MWSPTERPMAYTKACTTVPAVITRGEFVQRCDLWVWRRNGKMTENFMRQTGYLPRPLTSTDPQKFCLQCRVREVFIYFKFHENRPRGLGSSFGGSKIALSIDLTHDSNSSLFFRTSRHDFKILPIYTVRLQYLAWYPCSLFNILSICMNIRINLMNTFRQSIGLVNLYELNTSQFAPN